MNRYELGCRHLGEHRSTCVARCASAAGAQVPWIVTGWRLLRLVSVLGLAVPLCLARMAVPGYARQRRRSAALRRLSRQVLAAVGIDLRVQGTPRTGPSLVVANHTSWLDQLVLSAAAPLVPVAKSEVASWPLVGAVARRSGAVFVRREALRTLPSTVDEMVTLMRRGHRVQVFPEATTRCGLALGEFHRAGFQAAIDAAVVVQPAAIRVLQQSRFTTAAAFVGNETLATSLFRTVRTRDIQVDLQWLRPIPAIAGTGRAAVDRATVARLSQNAIARALGRTVVPRRQHRTTAPAPAPRRTPTPSGSSWQAMVSRGRF